MRRYPPRAFAEPTSVIRTTIVHTQNIFKKFASMRNRAPKLRKRRARGASCRRGRQSETQAEARPAGGDCSASILGSRTPGRLFTILELDVCVCWCLFSRGCRVWWSCVRVPRHLRGLFLFCCVWVVCRLKVVAFLFFFYVGFFMIFV